MISFNPPMPTYKTKAIILSSYPYREHDRIISFYSSDYGRLEARARGTRKIQSKLAGHLEPFLEVELLLANGKFWDILASSRTLMANELIRGDVACVASASVCAEAVKLITKPLAADKRVYDLLKNVFGEISQNKAKQREAVIKFLWQLLHLSGFAPEINKCINCKQGAGSGYFSFEGGGLLCAACRRRDIMAMELRSDLLFRLRAGKLSEQMQELVIRFWERVVDHAELRSLGFWRVINEASVRQSFHK